MRPRRWHVGDLLLVFLRRDGRGCQARASVRGSHWRSQAPSPRKVVVVAFELSLQEVKDGTPDDAPKVRDLGGGCIACDGAI
jgi:hypothetical protein